MSGAVNLGRAGAVDGWLARLGRGRWAPRCLVCGEAGEGRLDLCGRCEAALPWMPPACACCAMPLPARATESAARAPPRSPAGPTVKAPVGAAIAAITATPQQKAIPVGAAIAAITATPQQKAIAAIAAPTARPARLCSACQHDPPPLAEVHAAFLYGFPLDRLLPRLKFHRDLAAGRLLAQAMATAFAGCERPQALVPVPLHRARLRQRGYNQAQELARPLGRILDLPLRTDLLQRIRNTPAQSRLDADARASNLRDAFEVPG